jgi:hypothetical protein
LAHPPGFYGGGQSAYIHQRLTRLPSTTYLDAQFKVCIGHANYYQIARQQPNPHIQSLKSRLKAVYACCRSQTSCFFVIHRWNSRMAPAGIFPWQTVIVVLSRQKRHFSYKLWNINGLNVV